MEALAVLVMVLEEGALELVMVEGVQVVVAVRPSGGYGYNQYNDDSAL
jgi:hypothetical protein